MTPNEIAWLIGLSLFGVSAGIVCGWIAARRSKGVENAFINALLTGLILPLIFCFVIGLFESRQPKGFSITDALLSGFGVMMYLGIGMVAFAAPASVISAIISHTIFSQCCQNTKKPNRTGHDNPY